MSTVLSSTPLHLSLDLALGRHSTEEAWLLVVDAINDELRDEDVDFFSDDVHVTDYSSSVSSPTGMQKQAPLSAQETNPTRPKQRRKRNRMSPDERKVRHREVQRQFMKRKRARIAELRKIQSGVEKQLRLVRVLVEVEQLKIEQAMLQHQYERCEKEEPPVVVGEASHRSFDGLVLSVPSEEVYETADITAMEWDELLAVFSDNGELDADVESDSSSVIRV